MSSPRVVRSIVAAVALAAVAALAAPAQAAGILVPRDGREPVTLRSHRVTAMLFDGIARTTVRQTFVSQHGGALEAIYLFPVPEDAVLVDVAMEVGGQRLEGLVVERTRWRSPNLFVQPSPRIDLTQAIDDSRFRLLVNPVLPDQDTAIELTWIQRAPMTDARVRYVYPLARGGHSSASVGAFSFSLHVDSAATIESLSSTTHDVTVGRVSGGSAVVTFESRSGASDRDLMMEAKLVAPETSLSIRTFQDPEGALYVAAVATPGTRSESAAPPNDITIILDHSMSMEGWPLEVSVLAAERLLQLARDDDRVNVVLSAFSNKPFAAAPVPMDPTSRAELGAFVQNLKTAGGSGLGDALLKALAEPVTPGRSRTIVLLSDGRPTVGVTDRATIVKAARSAAASGVRVVALGVGWEVDMALLLGICTPTRGHVSWLSRTEEIESQLVACLRRADQAVMTHPDLSVVGKEHLEAYPRPLPDDAPGDQLVVSMRFDRDPPRFISMRMVGAGKQIELTAPVPLSATPGGDTWIRQLFALQKLEFLEEAFRMRRSLDDEVYQAMHDPGGYSTGHVIAGEFVATSLIHSMQSVGTTLVMLLPEDRARIRPWEVNALREARSRVLGARRAATGLPIPQPGVGSPSERPENRELDLGLYDAETKETKPNLSEMLGCATGPPIRNAVDSAIAWLARHQTADGSWDVEHLADRCRDPACRGTGDPANSPAVTGLALLSFLGDGETPTRGYFKDVVGSGLRHLRSIQDAEGCFGPRTSARFQFNHACAALAMTEAYRLSGGRILKDSAQRGVNFILASQNPYLGWRYGVRDGDNDTRMTAWMTMVLRSAQMARLKVDTTAYTGALSWFDRMVDPSTGRVGNQFRGGGPTRPDGTPSLEPSWSPRVTTALASIARILAGDDPRKSQALGRSITWLADHPPVWSPEEDSIALEAWYGGTLATFRAGGPEWKTWSDAMNAAVIDSQITEQGSHARGSWDPHGPWAREYGRIYSTSLLCLCLQVVYRYESVFGAK